MAREQTSAAERLDASPRWPILHALKRSSGLCIADLSSKIGLSYMGTKQHCLALEKKGYLTSRSEHQGTGRPRCMYALTPYGHLAFHREENPFAISLLRQARQLFGPGAAGKMLYLHYQERTEYYVRALDGIADLERRLAKLAELRDEEGCMASADGTTLVERHFPWAQIFAAFPEAEPLEEACLSKALGTPLKRSVVVTGPNKEVRYRCVERPV